MLEMSTEDTVVLSLTKFDQFVRDVWVWTSNDEMVLGEYAAGVPVYRKARRDWDDEDASSAIG
jgi:hypothetical protein